MGHVPRKDVIGIVHYWIEGELVKVTTSLSDGMDETRSLKINYLTK